MRTKLHFLIPTCLFVLSQFLKPIAAWAETSGSVRYEGRDFYEGQVSPIQHYEDLLTLTLDGKYNLSESARFLLGPVVEESSGPGLIDVSEPWTQLNFRDTYLEFRRESLHLQIGSMVKMWEGPDGYNPMDIATVKNFRDPLSPENVGSFGLAASGGEGLLTWDLLYIPHQREVELPGARSRWLPRHVNLSLASENAQLLLPSEPQYIEDNHEVLNSALDNNYGGRLQLHRTQWDFSAAYYEGSAQVPGIAPTVSGDAVEVGPQVVIQAGNPIELQAVEYRRRTVAAGVVASGIESWIFRLAGRYDIPFGFNPAVPQRTSQFVGAAEKTAVIFGQTVIASLGYAFGQKFETHSGEFTILDPFSSAWMYGVRWPFDDRTTLQIYGLGSPATRSTYNNFHLERKINDHFSVDGGVQWMSGPGNSPMGIWADQNRISIAGTYLY